MDRVFFLLIPAFMVSAQTINNITFMTEEYPPSNFTEDGRLQGITVDCLEWMMNDLGTGMTREDFIVVPWARGYNLVQKQANTALFGMTKTEARTPLFKWVGPINPSRIALVARKDSNITITSESDIARYNIGVVKDDIGEQLLREMNLSRLRLDSVADPDMNAKKLASRRIDIWAYGDDVAMWLLKKNGFDTSEYKIVYILSVSEQYYAFHKDTPQPIIDQLQGALDRLQATNEYQEILNRYK